MNDEVIQLRALHHFLSGTRNVAKGAAGKAKKKRLKMAALLSAIHETASDMLDLLEAECPECIPPPEMIHRGRH